MSDCIATMREAGALAYGEHWPPRLAADMRVSEGYVRSVLRGDRPFTHRLGARLTAAMRTASTDLRNRAGRLDALCSNVVREAV